ncbi:MAG: hydroxyacid dehydrogenase [Planctomycetes bacterium]|nr:hydroxyacid dehydrogenase [Planctomycetota bacterium]
MTPLFVIPDDLPPQFGGAPALRLLEARGRVVIYPSRAASEAELIGRLRGALAALCVRNFTRFTAAVLDSLPDLRLISLSGTGTDNVDLDAAARRNITVCNTPGASSVSVAEHTFGLILAAARSIPLSDRTVRQGRWEHRHGFELQGKTLGLVGLGRIAQHVSRIAHGFDMHVLAWSFTRDEARARACGVEQVELPDLLERSDVVSVHVRVSDRTRGLLGPAELARMKPTALLVNTARGAVIDELALAWAIQEKRIAGAALDVFCQEPLPAGHPFLGLDNVVLSPHAGWVTREANERLIRLPIENILAFLDGRPQNVVQK